ncbi:MAG TPA: M57 family metalloprotease [Longimicrobium sp.]|nr:M57 family metalloprotease [Longimicrobium sp.]
MMHRTRARAAVRAAALLLAGALAACSDTGAPTAAAPEQDPLVEALVAMGAKRETIVDGGDHFVVEGDIKVYKKDLRPVQPNDGKAHPGQPSYQRYNTVVAQNRRHITVDVSAIDAESASWGAATRAAMNNWSAVSNTYIRYVEGGPADVTVSWVNSLPNCGVARGSWPANGAPGTTVEINRTFSGSYVYGQQVWIMTHELGHNIGMAHTDQSFGTLVPGTPTSDGGSVMNSGNTYGGCPPAAPSWSGFSSNDQKAARYLYPLPAPSGLTSVNSGGNVLVSWSGLAGAQYYEARRIDRRVYSNPYEGWEQVYDYPGGWWSVYGTSFDSGTPYTGVSYCLVRDTGYEQEYTESWYEVRAVFSTGTGPAATVWTNDVTC